MILRLLIAGLLAVNFAACSGPAPSTPDAPAPPYLIIHQYNPTSDAAHARFLDYVAALNQAVQRTELSRTQYLVWKVDGRQEGPFSYVLGSLWRDQATYETVHKQPAVEAVRQRHDAAVREPFRERETSEYVLLNPAAPPDFEQVTHLRMERAVMKGGEDAEAQLIEILEEASRAIARTGHPETRLDLWRRVDDRRDDTYLLGSLWKDRDAHDAARAHPAYQHVIERHQKTYEALVEPQGSNRYERIPL